MMLISVSTGEVLKNLSRNFIKKWNLTEHEHTCYWSKGGKQGSMTWSLKVDELRELYLSVQYESLTQTGIPMIVF
jgi:hypothetical protein